MAFPPQFLDEIRARVSLSGMVGRRVKLQRRGREFTGLCPFHNEKTPSFTVSDEKSFFHCFGCGRHGDAIGWVMETDGLSFPEAVEKLAQEAGLEVPRQSPDERARETKRATLIEAMEAACAHYEAALWGPGGREALAYLRGRGLDDATIRTFRLGYAGHGNPLKAALVSETMPEAMLIECGLMRKPDDGRPTFDFFRDRVLFPIMDGRGRVIAFGGRIMGAGEPKYLNSPDTPLFDKRRTLYGLHFARKPAHDRHRVLVTEGYMDVIALAQAGFGEAVAPLGTALTEEHIAALWKMADEPVLCFDGDKAGFRAAGRAAERALPLLEPGRSLRFVTMPQGEDPDSLIRKEGAAAMEALIGRAEPLDSVVWRLETEGKAADTPERLAGLEKRLEEQALRIADRKVQFRYLASFRDRVKALAASLRPDFAGRGGSPGGNQGFNRGFGQGSNRGSNRGSNWGSNRGFGQGPGRGSGRAYGSGYAGGAGAHSAPAAPRTDAQPRTLRRRQEQVLLACVLNHPSILDMFAEDLAMVNVSDPMLDNLRQEILKVYAADTELDSERLRTHLKAQGNAEILDSVLGQDVYVHAGFARRDAAEEVARAGFLQVLAKHLEPGRRAELEEARHVYVDDPTEENWNRFEKLKADRASSGADDTPV
jgi:DNA primase